MFINMKEIIWSLLSRAATLNLWPLWVTLMIGLISPDYPAAQDGSETLLCEGKSLKQKI